MHKKHADRSQLAYILYAIYHPSYDMDACFTEASLAI